MKRIKRIAAVVMAAIMALAMSITAFASETKSEPTISGQTYNIYQVFTGDYSDGVLSNVRWGKNFFRSGFYIPVLIRGIVSGFIWKIMYNYNFGTFNAVLGSLGLDKWKQDWLGNSSPTLLMIGVVLIWKGAGYYMIIYLASLQSVSTDLIEAAQIDGASPIQRFKAITIPLISGAFTINFTLSLINGLKVFDQINVMTDGGPGFTSETLVYLLYKVGFNEGRQGFGTAVGIMLLFIIIVLNTIQQKFLRSREVQM